MARKRSRVLTIPTDELQILIDNSNALIDVIEKLGYNRSSSGTYKLLKKRIEEENLDISKLEKARAETYKKNNEKAKRISFEEILIENSLYRNITHLKVRLIREGLLINKCSECNLPPEWNGKPITMVLDHINGINNDNRLENLRLLCPNCNSQTDTFSGRNCKK